MSYTKAIIDYELATLYKDKKLKLEKIKIYYPSDEILAWKESITLTPGAHYDSYKKITDFNNRMSKHTTIQIVTKTMKDRGELVGDYCIRLYYTEGVHLPADPALISSGDIDYFLDTYTNFFNAYSVTKKYVDNLRNRITILKDV